MNTTPESAAPLRMRSASEADLPRVMTMLRAFYAEDRVPFDEARVSAGLRALVSEPAAGALLMLEDAGETTLGYVVLGWCFSVEQGGRFLLLDELYLLPQTRGRGLGRACLAMVRQWAVEAGARALRLEVSRHNPRARALYLSAGYRDDERDILTLLLPR